MKTRLSITVIALLLVSQVADAQNRFHRRRGAIIGGLAGAALGAAIGDKGDNETAGALIGGAFGAVAGGAIGDAKDQRFQQNRRYHSNDGRWPLDERRYQEGLYRQDVYGGHGIYPSHGTRPVYRVDPHSGRSTFNGTVRPAVDPYGNEYYTGPSQVDQFYPGFPEGSMVPQPQLAPERSVVQPSPSFHSQSRVERQQQPDTSESSLRYEQPSEIWSNNRGEQSMSIYEVIDLSRSGVSDTLVIHQIRDRGMRDSISVSQIIDMHNRGVSKRVIESMQQYVVPSSGDTMGQRANPANRNGDVNQGPSSAARDWDADPSIDSLPAPSSQSRRDPGPSILGPSN